MEEDSKIIAAPGMFKRKVLKIFPSKYEAAEAIHENKKYWRYLFNELDMSVNAPTDESKSYKISEVLPRELYEKVCQILDIPIVPESNDTTLEELETGHVIKRLRKTPLLSYRQTLDIERDADSDTDVEVSPRDQIIKGTNAHRELLSKPEREQITWPTRYLQPQREEEKSLVRRADDLTDRIVNDFCGYMKQLGGDQQSQLFTPKAIKELFQIEFDTHVARGLSVVMKELPSVSEKIAEITGCPEKSHYNVLQREVSRDIYAEKLPHHDTAFGRSLPLREQWRTPNNHTQTLWRSQRHVPLDLVTLKTVWEGITHLRSVREYCRWMVDHPEHRRAPYLSSLGMFEVSALAAGARRARRPLSPK